MAWHLFQLHKSENHDAGGYGPTKTCSQRAGRWRPTGLKLRVTPRFRDLAIDRKTGARGLRSTRWHEFAAALANSTPCGCAICHFGLPAYAPQRTRLVQSHMIGLVALNFVLRVLLARVVDISFVIHVLRVHLDDSAADSSGLRIPTHPATRFESFCHNQPCASTSKHSRTLAQARKRACHIHRSRAGT